MERKAIMIHAMRSVPSSSLRLLFLLLLVALIVLASAYDPDDKSLKDILLPEGQFEAFYLKGTQDEEQNAVRPPHLHGSFHQYRNPALVGAPNSAAYGFRFDGAPLALPSAEIAVIARLAIGVTMEAAGG